jgi:quinoprotein glucose dehydrogenase
MGTRNKRHGGVTVALFRLSLATIHCLAAFVAESAAGDFDTVQYAAADDWPYYNGSPAGTHYSRLSDINTRNIRRLKLAWSYDTGDELGPDSTMESNPLIIRGRLFFISPLGRLISLDAATGRERWTYSPQTRSPDGFHHWRRGGSYWTDGKQERIFFTFASDLYAIDPDSGRPIQQFGSAGHIALGSRMSSPPAIYRDLVIVGGNDSSVRGFDVRTGDLRWKFHTIPRPGEFGYETWPPNAWTTTTGVNNWGGMSVDQTRGIVFVPLAAPRDLIGANRAGDNLFANSLVAIDANTGHRLWHFQTIRHDMWDWDLPAPPTLVTVRRNGERIDAVALVSKVGFVYVLERVTGRSLFPLIEKRAFRSDIPGVEAAATQVEPQLPLPLVRQYLTASDLTRRTPQSAAAVAAQFSGLRSRGLWDPPSEQGTILLPGIEGGAEWGGAAFHPQSALLFVNAQESPWILKLRKHAGGGPTSGSALYRENCAGCHGDLRKGGGEPQSISAPSLAGIGDRLAYIDITERIIGGGSRMPGFPFLADDPVRMRSLITFLQTGIDTPALEGSAEGRKAAVGEPLYVVEHLSKFVDPDGYPAISPPWGTLSAINLNTGQYQWKIPFGEHPELAARGVTNTGSENYGGPIVTAGGLLFIGATSFDKKFRAYDLHTGKLLWETVLPAAGNATPATYRVNGRQFIVIAAGGGRPGVISGGLKKADSGSRIIAFTLQQ